MLKKSVFELDKNVFELLDRTTGIVVAGDQHTAVNGMQVSWGSFGILFNKPTLTLYIRKSRYTHEILDKTNSVTISFLSDKYKEQLKIFGTTSGRNVNKFKESNFHTVYEVDYDGYYIAEADIVFKCKILYKTDLDYTKLPQKYQDFFYKDGDAHTIYIAEITHYLVNEE